MNSTSCRLAAEISAASCSATTEEPCDHASHAQTPPPLVDVEPQVSLEAPETPSDSGFGFCSLHVTTSTRCSADLRSGWGAGGVTPVSGRLTHSLTHPPPPRCTDPSSTSCVCSHPWGRTGTCSSPTSALYNRTTTKRQTEPGLERRLCDTNRVRHKVTAAGAFLHDGQHAPFEQLSSLLHGPRPPVETCIEARAQLTNTPRTNNSHASLCTQFNQEAHHVSSSGLDFPAPEPVCSPSTTPQMNRLVAAWLGASVPLGADMVRGSVLLRE